jgi:hypothetical protein
MAIFGPFKIYATNPVFVFKGKELSVGKSYEWTGETTPSGTTTITDNGEGWDGLTFEDDWYGETATATTTVGGKTSTNSIVSNERIWTVRDTLTNKEFEVSEYEVKEGNALGSYTLSERPFVKGRLYEVIEYSMTPGVTGASVIAPTELNPVITYSEIVCFARGTRIKAISGEVAVEDLRAGDLVITKDDGYQPIRWIGSRKVPAQGNLAPILIREGTLGNSRDLKVSPQHRMLLQGWAAELLFSEFEVLVAAKFLINDHSIVRVEGGDVEYFHVLFDRHQIIFGEGCPSESFHPGKQSFKTLDQATRDELITLFPELENDTFDNYGSSVRMSLKRGEGALLADMMLK